MHCFAVGSESVLVRLQFPLCGDKIRIATGTLKPLTLLYMGAQASPRSFLLRAGLAWPAVCTLKLHQRRANGSLLKRQGTHSSWALSGEE